MVGTARRRPVTSATAPHTGAKTVIPRKYAVRTMLTANSEPPRPTKTAIAVPIRMPDPNRVAPARAIAPCWRRLAPPGSPVVASVVSLTADCSRAGK
jgi:hypothetical protein